MNKPKVFWLFLVLGGELWLLSSYGAFALFMGLVCVCIGGQLTEEFGKWTK